jgi:hypothetical protein
MTPFTGDKPQRNARATFSTRADAFITWWLDTFWDELDTAITAFNFNATNSTSVTSLLISVASKSLTVQTGKSYVPGQAVTIAYTTDATQWMRGEVTSYDSGTGALVVNVRVISATTGTYTAWTISQAAVEAVVTYNRVTTHTANGHGSTNNKVPRYTTASINTGTAITYADSAANGASFTINESGIYAIYTIATNSGGASNFGVSINSTQLTTSITSITAADRLILGGSSAASNYNATSRICKLVAGDVIRPHDDGTTDGSSELIAYFDILKVAAI